MTIYVPVYYKTKKVFDPSTVTVTGDVLIENGVASGFSESNYITVDKVFTINPTDTYEIGFTFTTPGSQTSSTRTILSIGNPDSMGSLINGYEIQSYANSTPGDIYCSTYYNKSGETTNYLSLMNLTNYGDEPTYGKKYFVKINYLGNKRYSSVLYDAETGENLISTWKNLSDDQTPVIINSEGKISMGYPIYDESFGTKNPFTGKIDLNNCYIKVNDEYVWKSFTEELVPATKDDYDVVKTVKAKDVYFGLKNIDNFTKVGDPTVVDGVASNFTKTSYLTSDQNIVLGPDDDWELQVSLMITHVLSPCYAFMIGQPTGINSESLLGCLGFYVGSAGCQLEMGSTNATSGNPSKVSWVLSSSIQLNHSYILNVKYNKEEKTLQVVGLRDGVEWLNKSRSVASYNLSVNQNIINIGYNPGYPTYNNFTGSIDVYNSYIKVNGATVWSGKKTEPRKIKQIYNGKNIVYSV